MAKSKQNPVTRANKTTSSPRSGLVGRPEIRILISLFVIAGLVLTFRHANDLSNPIGPPWMEEMARDITALGSYAVLIIITGAVVLYLLFAQRRAPRFGSHSRS